MVQHHSTLELVRHDETARAPELYNNVPASELDTTCLAPQVQSEVTPQVFYSTSLPEAHGNIENSKERDPSQSHTKIAFKWSWIVIAFVVAAAIALGTGLGIWHNREHSSHHVSTTSPSAPPNPNTTTLNTTNPSIAPAQYILNDTSLEAAILPNGDRHLFFQDSTGLIRRAIRSASTNSWNTGLHLSISSNAKNYTPLAVTVAAGEGLGYGDNSQRIQLFYVSENDRLNSKYFVDGSWSTELSLENYTTAENTRQLSVTLVNNTLNNPGDPSNTVLTSVPMTNTNLGLSTNITTAAVTALLLFENSIGNVTALANIAVRCTMSSLCKNQTLNEWVDISSQRTTSLLEFDVKSLGDFPVTLYESAPEATFSAPFTSGRSLYYDRDQLSRFQALFYMASDASSIAGSATRNGFISTDWYFTPSNGSEGFDSRMIADTNSSISPYSIHQSDIALIGSSSFAIWINATQPTIFDYPENTNSENTTSENTTSENTTSENTTSGNTTSENTTSEYTTSENTTSENTNSENTNSEYVLSVPNNVFPFARLASVTSLDHTVTFLYHQINGTTFAEEQWDTSLNEWVAPVYISVSNS